MKFKLLNIVPLLLSLSSAASVNEARNIDEVVDEVSGLYYCTANADRMPSV
jgi:hypothetical protein